MIKHNVNRNDDTIKESYNDIYDNFLNDKEEQKSI